MNAREALNSAVDALEMMGFGVLPRSEVEEKDKEIAALREALRGMSCPRPCNHRPDDFDVGPCFDAGECGRIAGTGLAYNTGGQRC